MLECRGVVHRHDGRTILDVPALNVAPGRATALVGHNGAGKSTLLRILAMLESPTDGQVLLDGTPVTTAAERRAARRTVTLVEQRPLLFRGTIMWNLKYAMHIHGCGGAEARHRANRSLERLDLGSLADRRIGQLSDGEVQRAAVARALCIEPRVLLLDEPTSAADRAAAMQLHAVLDDEKRAGRAICFASHELERAHQWADDVLALERGRLGRAAPENLFRVDVQARGDRAVATIGPLEVQLVTDLSGPATISLAPEDLVVSTEPMPSSARNRFHGRVVRIAEHGRGRVTLTVDTGVELVARVTPTALQELGITLGTEVFLSIKAVAVRVF